MKKTDRKLHKLLFLAVLCVLFFGNTKARAAEDPYSGMTVLDIAKGAVIIDTDSITGHDINGDPVTEVNAKGYHIVCSGSQTSNKITVEPGVKTTIVADNLTIVNRTTDMVYPSPLFLRPGASVTLILEGNNLLIGGDYNASIGVPQDYDGTKAELTIEGNGTLNCQTGKRGAGIGGGQKCGYTGGAGDITINSGTIYAFAGDYGGGIGHSEVTSDVPNHSKITINGGTISAYSNSQSSGIGGGRNREEPKADIVINGGILYSTGPEDAIRGTTLQVNGGNIIACQDYSTTNWQSFNPMPSDRNGNAVKFASVQLDSIDKDAELTVVYASRSYTVQSDKEGRVNVILFDGDGNDIQIKSETGNEYVLDYGLLPTETTVTDRPYRYPLLTITPDQGQEFQYGDPLVPSYKLYDEHGNMVDNTKSIITGAIGYNEFATDFLPYTILYHRGNLRVTDGAHCITFTPYVTGQVIKRQLKVSAEALEVYDGQYSRYNLPFVFRIEEGSLLPGDTIEDAFTFTADSNGNKDYYTAGEYTDIGFTFQSSEKYNVSLKDKGADLNVLENECLLKQGDLLTFGTDLEGNPVQWLVVHVTDQNAYLYSKQLFDQDTYDNAKVKKAQSEAYVLSKVPTLADYDFIADLDLLDSRRADEIYKDGGMENTWAEDFDGNPSKYWMFYNGTPPYDENSVYMDESGILQESLDTGMTAGVRLFTSINIRTHTVPVITLSDKITSETQYGDITAGTNIAQIKDRANLTGHELLSYTLLDKSTAADSFSVGQDGAVVANKRLEPGTYTLYIESVDTTGYKTERPVTFTVRKRQLAITPESGISIFIGDAVPDIPYTYDSSRLLKGDTLTGTLAVEGDLSAAGWYPVTLGTLSGGSQYHLVLAGNVGLNVRERISTEQGDSKGAPGRAVQTGDTQMPGMLLLFSSMSAVLFVSCFWKRKRRKQQEIE